MAENKQPEDMKGAFALVAFFFAGVACGRLHALPLPASGSVSVALLCALILCVGISIGGDRSALARFRSLGPAMALLPFASMLGTIAASMAFALAVGGYSVQRWLAVGCGMGYYSLSSVIISSSVDAALGAVALLSNIVREVAVLLFAPMLARAFGPLGPIAAAGATAMDTSLPAISNACGARFVPVSIYCGMVTDFSVPFLVTLFCTI